MSGFRQYWDFHLIVEFFTWYQGNLADIRAKPDIQPDTQFSEQPDSENHYSLQHYVQSFLNWDRPSSSEPLLDGETPERVDSFWFWYQCPV